MNLLLREKDKQKLQQLLSLHLPNVTAWAYGSRVTGEAHDASDLDIVLRNKDLKPISRQKLQGFLEAVRESNIPILVDVHDWASLPVYFHEEILKHHVELKNEQENLA